jgi:hypothetical protein
VKNASRKAVRALEFRRAMGKVLRLPAGRLPSAELLSELRAGWGNDDFAARDAFLREVLERAVTTSGPILECGSGLSTILLGLFAGRRGIETWSLEHIPEWRDRVEHMLERYRLPNVHVALSPLRDYGDFTWYEAERYPLPNDFSLVICDGPPGTTPGGRYGLVPVLGKHRLAKALILLDDAHRPGEAEVLRRWETEEHMTVRVKTFATSALAVVTCPSSS